MKNMESKKTLSLVMPCYNEAENLPHLLSAIRLVVKRDDIEIIIVDNGSTDNTQEVLGRLLPDFAFVRTVKIKVNQGYGHGVIYGLGEARGEYLAWTHADMQTDPAEAIRALELIQKSDDPKKTFVKGSRKGRPFFDIFFTAGMGLFESLYLGVPLSDINAQPNLFHRSFFESWEDPPDDFSLDLYAFYMARKKGLNVVRFPVAFKRRLHGSSHWNVGPKAKIKFIKRILEYSFKLKKRLG